MPQAKVDVSFFFDIDSDCYLAKLKNTSDTPALLVYLSARDKEGERILPVYWSDNYIHLMPGEERTLTLTHDDDTFAYRLRVEGFNVNPLTMLEEAHRRVVE